MNKIDRFEGEFRFLSNFSLDPVFVFGRIWKTAEHAFQAAKTSILHEKVRIANQSSPGKAKRLGRNRSKTTIRADWEAIKIDIMLTIVRKKFSQHAELRAKLLATGDAELIEGNNWGDTFWGVDSVTGEGRNELGKILMQVREEMK